MNLKHVWFYVEMNCVFIFMFFPLTTHWDVRPNYLSLNLIETLTFVKIWKDILIIVNSVMGKKKKNE